MAAPSRGHDHAPAVPDRGPTIGSALSPSLSSLRLQGAIFLRGEYSEAWAYESMPSHDAAALLAPEARQMVLFHVVAQGRCWIEAAGQDRLWAVAGDVIVLPYNDEHRMGGSEPAACASITGLIDPPPWERMPVVRHGAGGSQTGLVCGYLTCEDPLFDPRMRVFPPAFVVTPPAGPAREWVRASIQYALEQTAAVSRDRLEAPTRIPELLLLEVLNLHLSGAPIPGAGWLNALRDPVLAPALAAVHAEPERRWTVGELARTVRFSPSLLDERFRDVLGVAPIRYLTGWRMHVAEDLLRSTDLGLAAVARRTGYESEEAFSRAFKRHHGSAPSVWRVRRP